MAVPPGLRLLRSPLIAHRRDPAGSHISVALRGFNGGLLAFPSMTPPVDVCFFFVITLRVGNTPCLAERKFPALLGSPRKINPHFFALTREKQYKKRHKKTQKHPPKTPKKYQKNLTKKTLTKAFALTREKINRLPGVAQMSKKHRHLFSAPWFRRVRWALCDCCLHRPLARKLVVAGTNSDAALQTQTPFNNNLPWPTAYPTTTESSI